MPCCVNLTQFAGWRGPQRRLKCKITAKEEGICAHQFEKQVQRVWGWFPHPSDLEPHLHSHELVAGAGMGRSNVVALQQGCVTLLLLQLRLFPCPGVAQELQRKATG